MNVKKKLLDIYYFPFLSKERENQLQKTIRDTEWDSVKKYIRPGCSFLDVGCGAGYNITKAVNEFGCKAKGVDPDPGAHGVGRKSDELFYEVIKAQAEKLPFENKSFDVVFCSHVLEHVESEIESLREMSRVMKDDGLLIIGMPTSTMVWINFVSQLLLTTHMRIVNCFMKPFINTGYGRFIHIFFPPSHSFSEKTILYDLEHYQSKNWKKIVSTEFEVTEKILPLLYPNPSMLQVFKMRKCRDFSSSVFFVCKKKTKNK